MMLIVFILSELILKLAIVTFKKMSLTLNSFSGYQKFVLSKLEEATSISLRTSLLFHLSGNDLKYF